ncbi:MAG: DUF3108 domain-containing protein [Nitrospinota bacterium]|nr:DUF3108 domain-containing protein [Nitrospinota bacterium]
MKYVKHLILLALTNILLWNSLSPILAESSKPPKSSSIINSRGEYGSFSPRGDIRRFSGETLTYDIDFLFFNKAATAQVRFYENQGKYFATLSAETKGMVGFFTDYRKHFYKASFDIVDQGQRVRTRKFERKVINGEEEERTEHFLDYPTNTHFWFLFREGELQERHLDPIPEGVVFDDILAFFYNFRNGVYGDLKKGTTYKIDTVPDKSMTSITTYINTEEEQEKFRLKERRTKNDEMLLKVLIPKDVFNTQSGELVFWASNHYIPLETEIKGYVLLGDLHGKLVNGVAGSIQ